MARKNKVYIKNKETGLYGLVPQFIFEHPVYGQHMELVDDAPCDCNHVDEETEILTDQIEDENMDFVFEGEV